jgi:hypothetical protein
MPLRWHTPPGDSVCRDIAPAPYTRRMLPGCEELVARGIPVTNRDRVCELCGADLLSERAILCRRRRIELREDTMRDLELRAVLPRWRHDGLTPPEMADRLRIPLWRVLDGLRSLARRGSARGR